MVYFSRRELQLIHNLIIKNKFKPLAPAASKIVSELNKPPVKKTPFVLVPDDDIAMDISA